MTEAVDTNVRTGSYETHLNRAGEGNDKAVLFLQGSGPGATAWSNWQFALPALGERFDCLAPDLIGYGKSAHPEAPPQGAASWLDIWVDQQIELLDNLGVGVGNSLAALEAGADQLDGSLRGLGAGAGNAKTELLAAVLDKMGIETGLDVFKLMDAAEYTIAPIMPFQPFPDRDSISIGYAGVYSTFLLHAKRAAERYDVDVREIMVELGRREAVAGQEDWVIDVAMDVAKEKEGAASS